MLITIYLPTQLQPTTKLILQQKNSFQVGKNSFYLTKKVDFKKWHPNFCLFWYNCYRQPTQIIHITHTTPPPCLRSAFALPPLQRWAQSEDITETPPTTTEPIHLVEEA